MLRPDIVGVRGPIYGRTNMDMREVSPPPALSGAQTISGVSVFFSNNLIRKQESERVRRGKNKRELHQRGRACVLVGTVHAC